MLVDIPDVGWQLAHIPYAIWLLVDIPEVGWGRRNFGISNYSIFKLFSSRGG
jgi:hypothetical protein